ncbi:MAG TPA: hypothetical protein VLB81_12855 [Gaiellales bacterium]|nr:hypothetical protein [Gaiellales bacterium]
MLVATALRGGSAPGIQAAAVAVSPPKHALAPDGPPIPTLMATGPNGLELDVPIAQARVTAIVYHGVGDARVIPLAPVGHQKNAGILTKLSNLITGASNGAGPGFYVDGAGGGTETGSVDIGAVAGTRVYSPVDGTVVGIRSYVLDGSPHGSVVQIQPTSTPADIVTLTNIRTSPQIAVGDQVIAARTRIGTVIDLSRVITQELAKYTSDAGNHVHLEVGPAPAASLLL